MIGREISNRIHFKCRFRLKVVCVQSSSGFTLQLLKQEGPAYP